ncbi:MAG: Nramp family divalent metal transporter [Deltaproteobacteria bacterium]|nr:Nramp family divalent metal transporter [Deltaproteobacteria bacterium]
MKRHSSFPSQQQSLAEVNESVNLPSSGSRWWRHWLAFSGPALMVSVGYMDPGNWATDLAGGSRYNYKLIWVLLMSNLMAVLLQSLSARLGIVSRRDLAQANHEEYAKSVNIPLYLLAEIAITACDLAEVLGSAIAFNLLFGLPLIYGVMLTTLDVLLLLALSRFGIRKLEAVILSLVGTIGVGFLIEIFLSKPDWGGLVRGFAPSLPDNGALYIAMGILGATVMPHNLYLHSSLVQTRRIGYDRTSIKQAIRWNTIDSAVALNLAFFVNSAILIMAAAVFYRSGHYEVAEIQGAHRLLEPLLGVAVAPFAFAIALLASGQSSTITGTLAGQIVMEGYLNLRIRPWLRRLITRILAVLPAVCAIWYFGENSTGSLLVLSQVVLSLQLPFAIIPLIHFVSDKRRMGEFVVPLWLRVIAWLVTTIIVVLNVKLVMDEINSWLFSAQNQAWVILLIVLPLSVLVGFLLMYITFRPWIKKVKLQWVGVHGSIATSKLSLPALNPYRRVAVALDFSNGEERLLAEAMRVVGGNEAKLILLHVVESPVALAMRQEAADHETLSDQKRLEDLTSKLREMGINAEWRLGTGSPAPELARMINELDIDLVILGGHGHSGFSDILHGTTVEGLRHRIQASVLVVSLKS